MNTCNKTFLSRIDLLYSILEWIDSLAKKVGFEGSSLQEIELAVEEALVNIIHHAYQGRSGNINITITSVPQKAITIILEDEGPLFDPLAEKINLETNVPLEKRHLGGLGIMLIRKNMDVLQYERIDEKNRLTMVKKLV